MHEELMPGYETAGAPPFLFNLGDKSGGKMAGAHTFQIVGIINGNKYLHPFLSLN
jgi:hypothetical protein